MTTIIMAIMKRNGSFWLRKLKLLAVGALGLLVGCGLLFALVLPLIWRTLPSALAVLVATAALGGLLIGTVMTMLRRPLGKLAATLDQLDANPPAPEPPLNAQRELFDLTAAIDRLRERLRETSRTKRYLDVVLNSMNDAVLVTDEMGRITKVNDATVELFGFSHGEIIARDIGSLIAPDERRKFVLDRAVTETREFMIRAKNGANIPVSISGARITDPPQTSLFDDNQSSDVQEHIQGCVFVAHNLSERVKAERRILYLATYDTLTKIPNRLQFQHLLQQAIARSARNGTALALFYLDLDKFKEVNDTFGHSSGDRALEILSERLGRIVPKSAVIGRLAGDEFTVLVENLPRDTDQIPALEGIARQLINDVGRPFHLDGNEVYISVSIGIAICPDHADNTIDLIRDADTAMYHAKQAGGGTFSLYAPTMSVRAVEQLTLKAKLRRALERDEFMIHYQPKIDLATGRIAGAEALLRWRLPGHGDIAPSAFIPLAESTGLILPIGEWVLRRVCADYQKWQRVINDPGRISINLSLKQLHQASFISEFSAVFTEHGVAPDCLELEITETTLMSNAPRAIEILQQLRAIGIGLSIDDFGTGYSSLSLLQQLPVETLKIDQSFVRNAVTSNNESTLIRTIIEMGHNLKMNVVAEGVETTEQFEFLRRNRCDFAQGRLFSPPVNADSMLEMLQRQQNTGSLLAPLISTHEHSTHLSEIVR
jgi:diguanylate cyclase (GGDEF)-like protein/PAS domain S-box-containing protein